VSFLDKQLHHLQAVVVSSHEKGGPISLSDPQRLDVDPDAHVQLHLRQVPRFDGVEHLLGLRRTVQAAVRSHPRLLQHRPAHFEALVVLTIAAIATPLQLLLERRRRARKATALCGSQVGQDGCLETGRLSVRERHLRADFWATLADFLTGQRSECWWFD
jgi:hypothetical protein